MSGLVAWVSLQDSISLSGNCYSSMAVWQASDDLRMSHVRRTTSNWHAEAPGLRMEKTSMLCEALSALFSDM